MYIDALKSRLPLIAVWTEDTLNVANIIEHIVGIDKKVMVADQSKAITSANQYDYYIVFGGEKVANFELAYTEFSKHSSSLVVVNPVAVHPLMFKAGVVRLPRTMLHHFLSQLVENPDDYVDLFGGLTLKEVGEICRITMSIYGGMHPDALLRYRNKYTGQARGLQFLSNDVGYYHPPEEIKAWAQKFGSTLKNLGIPTELVPRGLVFDGPPGCGKTMGAKYLGQELSLPVYRLDLTAILGKYVGESEANLEAALAKVMDASPCIVLLDEVEKLFTQSDDSGVTLRLLSNLLWWLEEKRERVLVVMTTNSVGSIPPELFREGRIDSVIKFRNLQGKDEVLTFIQGLLVRYTPDDPEGFVERLFTKLGTEESKDVSPAKVTQLAKQLLLEDLTNE